jgi:hypothetical protein
MNKIVTIFVPGINTLPGSWSDWANRAAVWWNTKTDEKSDIEVYFTTALTVGILETRRAKNLGLKIKAYLAEDFTVNLVGHSNGTHIICDALRLSNWPHVNNVHLACGACDSNFLRSGVDFALTDGKIQQIFCYVAGKDMAMKVENTLLGKFLFQMNESDKPLGLVGPKNVSQSNAGKVHLINKAPWDKYGHSTCWSEQNFNQTMQNFL